MKISGLVRAVLPLSHLFNVALCMRINIHRTGEIAVDIELEDERVIEGLRPGQTYGAATPQSIPDDKSLQIEFGHGIHQGYLSDDGQVVKFDNIPYAHNVSQEDYRFAPPYAPEYEEGKVFKGEGKRICPQARPGWVAKSLEFLTEFGGGLGKLDPKWEKPILPGDYDSTPVTGGEEDCLYLDIVIPRKIWDERKTPAFFKPATVVWIHGGGFVEGSKYDIVSPKGILKAANSTEEQSVIFVSINYRLGLFGWLSGRKYEDYGGQSNLGLQDQKLALRWVANNIYAVGGDNRRITAMGQSAGAASIVHQLLDRDVSISSAIIQSPGFFPQPNMTQCDIVYEKVLNRTGATDIESLAKVKTEELMKINRDLVYRSPYSQFTFGPTVDGYTVRNFPGKTIQAGDYSNKVQLLGGSTGYDGLLFTPPWIRSTSGLQDMIKGLYPGMPRDALEAMGKLYPIDPPAGNGIAQRLAITGVSNAINDVAIRCNAHWLVEKAEKATYPPNFAFKYVFNALPAIHGSDLNYFFYPEKALPGLPDVDRGLAERMQQNLVDFIRYKDPNLEGKDDWPIYKSDNRTVASFGHLPSLKNPKGDFDWKVEDDPMGADVRRACDWWQSAPYWPAESRKLLLQGKGHHGLELL